METKKEYTDVRRQTLDALDVFEDNINKVFKFSGVHVARRDGEIYDHQKSVLRGYDCQFTVFRGSEEMGFGFTFFYGEQDDYVRVLGRQSFMFNKNIIIDDDDSDCYSAGAAENAVQIALDHLVEKYHKKVVVEPKKYYIGRYIAWNFE